MTDLIDTVQLQSINDSLIEFFEITLPGSTSIDLRLVSGLDDGSANIYFPTADGSALNEYIAIPIEMTGIEIQSDGAQNRPILNVANLVSLGRSITDNSDGTDDEQTWQEILEANGVDKPEDILGSRVNYRRTLYKNTYRVSDVAGWTTTLPIEFPKSTFVLERIKAESALLVSYELVSPIDLERVKLPSRIIIGKYCPWKYQGIAIDGHEGSGCTYTNTDDQTSFFDIDDNEITGIGTGYTSQQSYSVGTKIKYPTTGFVKIWESIKNPSGVNAPPTEGSRYWKRIDICGKTLNSCKVRYQGVDTNGDPLTRLTPLPFGGFPGTRKFK